MRPSSEERDKINLPREGSIAPKKAIFGAEETNFLSRHSSFSILKSSPSLRSSKASRVTWHEELVGIVHCR